MHPERSFLFPSECVTAVTPDGKIFVLGGQFASSYLKNNFRLKLKEQMDQEEDDIVYEPFEQYAHMAVTSA